MKSCLEAKQRCTNKGERDKINLDADSVASEPIQQIREEQVEEKQIARSEKQTM